MFLGAIRNFSKWRIKLLIWDYYFQNRIKYGKCLLFLYSSKTEIESVLDRFPSLRDKRNQKAGGLSTGEQQLLAMGRALM
jgi:ABC-type multidrug transport system ATPase subunit